jgi:hypothetical protein
MCPRPVLVLLVAAALVLQACSMSADTRMAEEAVVQFHALLDAGQSRDIYISAAPELKQSSTEKDFVAVLDEVHRELGTTRSAKRIGWKLDSGTRGTFVTLTYKTEYRKGSALEKFTFRVADGEARLASYHISSKAHIVGGPNTASNRTPVFPGHSAEPVGLRSWEARTRILDSA